MNKNVFLNGVVTEKYSKEFKKDELGFDAVRIDSLEVFDRLINRSMDSSFLIQPFGYDRYIFFRGVSNASYDIKTSLEIKDLINDEHSVYERMLYKAPKYFDSCQSEFEKLALMRHYGLPIRVVDFSKNPYVALFFACDADKEKDGAVYFVLTSKSFYNNSKLYNIVCKRATTGQGNSKHDPVGVYRYYDDEEIEYLLDLYSMQNEGMFFHEIPYRDERERNQQGLFLLGLDRLGMKKKCGMYHWESISVDNIEEAKDMIRKSKKHQATYDDNTTMISITGIQCYRADSKQYILKVIIPAHIKDDILKKIGYRGITVDYIYPSLEASAKRVTEELILEKELRKR